MKTYIISLKNSSDRRSSIARQANNLKLNYEIVDAVNGRELPENMLSILRKEYSYAITPGEIGCSLSHLSVYKKILSSTDEYALVLEDDVLLPDESAEVLKKLKTEMPVDKPCVCLLSKVNQFNKKPYLHLSAERTVHRVYNAAFSHAYIINKKAASSLIDNLLPVWCVADQWSTFMEFGFIQLYGVIPACINTHPVFEKITTIADRSDDSIQIDKKIAWQHINDNRPVKVKVKKAMNLLFHRPFQKIVKQ